MKKHLSKRLLSLFLAVVLLATSAPLIAFGYDFSSVQEAVQAAQDDGTRYLFAYFTSNSQYGQQIRFAVSDDGLNYEPLNYNRPIIEHSDETFNEGSVQANTQYVGTQDTSAGYARDPYIFKGNDGNYYLIATDMDASSGGEHASWSGDTCFAIWQSSNLIDWYQINVFDVRTLGDFECQDGTTRNFNYTIRAWAPQVIWDDAKGAYLLYWSNFTNDWYESIYGIYTTDFKNFDPSSIVEMYHAVDSEGINTSAIDGDITYYNGTYYLFYKQESTAKVGCVTSNTLTGPYDQGTYKDCTFSDDGVAVEGCQVYQIGNSNYYVLMLDEYVNGSFVLGITDDLSSLNFEKMATTDYSLRGLSPRHGSVIQISEAEYQLLLDTYTFTPEIGTIQYMFTNEENATDESDGGGNDNWYYKALYDASGHTFDGFISSAEQSSAYGTTTEPYISTGNGTLNLYNSQVAINDVDVESYLLSENFTVTFDYIKKNNSVTINGSTIYDFSTRPIFSVSDNPTDYIAVLNDGTLVVYAGDETYSTTSSNRTPLEGEQISYTITYDGETVILYMDYVEVARINTNGGIPNYPTNAAIYAGLGFSDHYGTSPGIYGSYENLTFHDRAFTATEAKINMPLTLDSLEACVSSFEDIITSGNIYINTPEAYKYYKEAQRLFEVRDYGTEDVTDEINTCTTNFRNAIENLELWTPEYQSENLYTSYMGQEQVEGNVIAADGNTLGAVQEQGGWVLDTGDVAANAQGGEQDANNNYREIRFAYQSRESSWIEKNIQGWGDYVWTGENVAMNVYGDSYIAVYDGVNETSFPLKVRYFRDNANTDYNCGLQSIYLANSNLTVKSQEPNLLYLYSLNDDQADATDFMWPNTYMHRVANQDVSGLGFSDTNQTDLHQYGYLSAVLDSDAFSNAENNLLVINPNVIFTDHLGNKYSFGNGGISSQLNSPVYSYYLTEGSDNFSDIEITSSELGAIADGNSATYYVINVEPIRTALEEGAEKLKTIDLSQLSETDMTAAFEAADNMMTYNPYQRLTDLNYRDGSYIAKDRMQEAAQTISNEVTQLVNAYDEETSFMDNDGYQLLNALRTNVEINSVYESNNAANYTESSWNEFVSAYQASIQEVNKLVTTPFENELNADGTKNTTIQEVVEKVYETYYGLRQRASFDELEETVADETINEKYNEDLGGDVTSQVAQNYTIGSWLDFRDAYDAAEKFLTESDTSDIPMYDGKVTTITTDTGIVFDNIYVEDPTNTSVEVDTSIALSDKVKETMDALVAPANDDYYEVYDAFMVVYGTQDMNAFTDEYLAQDDSILSLAEKNGTKDEAQTYTIDSGASAYAEYNGRIYKNAPAPDDTTFGGQEISVSIDDITSQMIQELNSANTDTSTENNKRQSYNVTFELWKNDQLVDTMRNAEKHYYGDVVDLNAAESDMLNGLTCYKWVVVSEDDADGSSSEKLVVNESNNYSVRIQSDSVIRAYCADNNGDSTAIPVEIQNVYGSTVETIYLPTDTNITLGTKNVTVDGSEVYNIPDVPFYTFYGWRVNGSSYSASTYNLADLASGADSVVIQAMYTASDGRYTITIDNNEVFTNRWYDDRVTVTSNNEDAYAILISENGHYSVAAYGNSYEFYVNRNMDFYTLTKDENGYSINNIPTSAFSEEEIYRLDNKLPFVYSSPAASGDNNDKYTTFSSFSMNLGEGVTITEVGTLYTTDDAIGSDADAMVYGGNNVSFIKSKDQSDFSNQYSLTFAGAADISATVYTRAYVKYSFTYTALNGESTTIQAIAYGNIVDDSAIF